MGLKALPPFEDEELDELYIAVGMRLTSLQENLAVSRSEEVRRELQRRWTIENGIRTSIYEARHNG